MRLRSVDDRKGARKRVLLVAPPNSYRIAPYIEAAGRLEIDVLVVSDGRHSLVSAVAEGIHADFDDPGAFASILDAVRARPVAGVIGSDDRTVSLASGIAQALGLTHNPPEAAELSRRKDLARARLREAGLPVPAHILVDLARPLPSQIASLRYPCVVKPLALSGSRGVIRADNPEELAAACERVADIIRQEQGLTAEERHHVLIEDFIPGPEFAVEGLLRAGEFHPLALFDKPEPLDGPYFEETYYVTPSRLDAKTTERIYQRVGEACAGYGLREGPVHAELRWHDDDAWILEVAARTIGGQCARLLRFGTGHGLEELVLAHAVGEALSVQADPMAAGVLMIPIPRAGVLRRVEGVLTALKVPYVEDLEISVREGYELVPLPEGSSYLGFIFARAPTPALVEQALREAHSRLRIVTAPAFRIAST